MKICVFSDIHGNFKQLKKLTKTKDFKNADIRICLGDVVGLGPYQKQCMDLLNKYEYILLLGNHEARMIRLIDDINPDIEYDMYKQFEMYRTQLKDYLPLFKKLPKDYTINIADKKIYFTHYGWFNNDMANKNSKLRNKSLLEQFLLKKREYDYVIYGHIHTPSNNEEFGTTFINVGSLGLKSPSNYLMITEQNRKLFFERKTIKFNKDKFLKKCKKLNYPCWEQLKYFSYDNQIDIKK